MTVKKEKLPRHVAIIMDGNGRWARSRALPRIEGHIAGIESVRDIVTMTRELHIPYLTLYAFSKENWTRPKKEVEALLSLLGVYLEKELPLMLEKDVRFNAIGAISDLPGAFAAAARQRYGENREERVPVPYYRPLIQREAGDPPGGRVDRRGRWQEAKQRAWMKKASAHTCIPQACLIPIFSSERAER